MKNKIASLTLPDFKTQIKHSKEDNKAMEKEQRIHAYCDFNQDANAVQWRKTSLSVESWSKQRFLNISPKVKINKLDFIKSKNFCSWKDTIKNKPQQGENICKSHF